MCEWRDGITTENILHSHNHIDAINAMTQIYFQLHKIEDSTDNAQSKEGKSIRNSNLNPLQCVILQTVQTNLHNTVIRLIYYILSTTTIIYNIICCMVLRY